MEKMQLRDGMQMHVGESAESRSVELFQRRRIVLGFILRRRPALTSHIFQTIRADVSKWALIREMGIQLLPFVFSFY